MIRVFAATQPSVLSMIECVPDAFEFPVRWLYFGVSYYLAKSGDGWMLYSPSAVAA